MSIIYRKENKEFPLRQPAAATNADGQPRSIGVEIELGGLDLDQITNRIQQVVGGEVERRSNYEGKVRGTRIGDIAVELDAQLFTDMKVRGMLDKLGLENIEPHLRHAPTRVTHDCHRPTMR